MPDFTSVSEILDTTRSTYMNDPTSTIYTNARLLPLFKTAYGFLETELEKNNIRCKKAVTGEIKISTGETVFPLPTDFQWPIRMEEKLYGSTDLFIPMVEKRDIPSMMLTDKLIYWAWNLESITLLGANTDRAVRLYYHKKFPAIQQVSDYALGKADQYLSAKTAALAHMFISQTPTLAEQCNNAAEENLSEIVNIFVKTTQGMPVRRKPYVPFR